MKSTPTPIHTQAINSNTEMELRAPSLRVRIGIVLYESFLLFSVLLLCFIPFVLLTNSTEESQSIPFNRVFAVLIIGLYFSFHWYKGKTLAMQTWRVIICNQDGSRLKFHTAVLRYLLCWPLSISLIGWIWLFFDKEQQLLQDRLLNTRMYRISIHITE